ncbi:DMT family transporter [Sphingobacterium wenxiniae]|uniref:EamA domain-containing membrane protein RarD n=1 Tax=Sphingobacterium wenxiniae TaxID=683125 RepID=A0A1I6V212_9SPHI|nr:DMT family transporter [Sphingobacterium wenxiniae]SFT07761.1 EamA domain-containing membrane protein RarD [Sphingobacterium wenxiniae]
MQQKSVLYMLLAGLFFALMNVCVKYVAHLPTLEVVFFRSIFSLIASYAILRQQRIPILGNNKKLLTLRGIAGCLGLIGSFYTLQNIPLASAVTINYLSPFFTAILGIFIVGQKLRPQQYIYFLLAIAGVWLLKGFDTRISTLHLIVGLSAALFAGVAYNIIAKLKTSEHPLVIIFYFPLVTIPVVGIYCLFHWQQPIGVDWLYLLLIGLFTQCAQYYMTLSYQQANLSKVASLNYLGVIYAILFGYFLFDEMLNVYSFIGIGIIILSVILNLRVRTKD